MTWIIANGISIALLLIASGMYAFWSQHVAWLILAWVGVIGTIVAREMERRDRERRIRELLERRRN